MKYSGMTNYSITFMEKKVSVMAKFFPDGEMEWTVFDVETDHLNLLDELLHENFDNEITDLIWQAHEATAKEYEMEQRLSDHEIRMVS